VNKYLRENFGVSKKALRNVAWLEGKGIIRITSSEYLREAKKLNGTSGVVLFRKGRVWNPTSNLIFVLSHRCKRKYELGREELISLLKEGEIDKPLPTRGYVILTFQNLPLILGFHKHGKIKCFMPKEFREQVLEILEGD